MPHIKDGIYQDLYKLTDVNRLFEVVICELHDVTEPQADTLLSDVGTYIGRYRQTYEF